MLSSLLPHLLAQKDLNAHRSFLLFDAIFSGKLSDSSVKTVLVLLSKKGEAAAEVAGCMEALRKNEPQIRTRIPGAVDTCGTGGDNSLTFNISTLAALIAAGAGCKIAKHGNRAFSSKCGSSDLMEALGVRLDAPAEKMIRAAREAGIGYFHAPVYHPAIAGLQKIRRSLGIKTIFNILGPLANPLPLEAKLAGVANQKTFDLYIPILQKADLKRTLLVYAANDGLDEISSSHPTQAAWIENRKVKKFTIYPQRYGIRPASRSQLKCGSLAESKARCLKILTGKEKGPAFDAILINAGAAIWVAGKARNLQQGIEKARQSMESGRAYKALRELARISNS